MFRAFFLLIPLTLFAQEPVDAILAATQHRVGVAIHLGSDDGDLRLSLAKATSFVIHGLEADAQKVQAARQRIRQADLATRVSVEVWKGTTLPLPDNFATIIMVESGTSIPQPELERVLSPGGSLLIHEGATWKASGKVRSVGMDEWTHLKHGPDGNPVSSDTIPLKNLPDHLRFITGEPRIWSYVARTNDGIFYSYEKTGHLRAYDAWNGINLWNTTIKGWPGRMVTVGGKLYLKEYLGSDMDQSVSIRDGRSGERIGRTPCMPDIHDFLVADGILMIRQANQISGYTATGALIWSRTAPEHPDKLVVDKKSKKSVLESVQQIFASQGTVYLATGPGPISATTPWKTILLGLNIATGAEVWRSEDPLLGAPFSLLLHSENRLLGVSGANYISLSTKGDPALWRLRVRTGSAEKLQDANLNDPRQNLVHRSCLVAQGLLWLREDFKTVYGETIPTEQERPRLGWIGIDWNTGLFKRRLGYPVRRDWPGISPASGYFEEKLDMPLARNWSARCYDDIAVGDCLLAETTEIVPLDGETDISHIRGVRGQCGFGYVVGNNLMYTPPNQCIGCYPMVRGLVAYETPGKNHPIVADDIRLERGPAFGWTLKITKEADVWPIYRHDNLRTSSSPYSISATHVRLKWEAKAAQHLTQAVVAGGRVIVASIAEGSVHAFDAASGKALWTYDSGSRIDTSPTLIGNLCVFGSHDGFITSLKAETGAVLWRFNAAPEHRRIANNGRLESPWPVIGSVLFHDGAIFASAGHYSALEGGLHVWALDPASGAVRFHTIFGGIRGKDAIILPTHWYKHEDHALNNVLLAKDGRIRLDEEWGGWDFSATNGAMIQQLRGIRQPGWPQDRISPGPWGVEDRWPWSGHDRVTAALILRGDRFGHERTLEVDPRTRNSGMSGQFMTFPGLGSTGILVQVKTKTTRVEPEPWIVPTEKSLMADPNKFAKDPLYVAAKVKLWPSKEIPLLASAFIFTKDTVWIAGTCPPSSEVQTEVLPPKGRLIALSQSTGQEQGTWDFPGEPAFEGLSAAQGRIYLTTRDGRVLCFTP